MTHINTNLLLHIGLGVNATTKIEKLHKIFAVHTVLYTIAVLWIRYDFFGFRSGFCR
jgi:hypothetical protein